MRLTQVEARILHKIRTMPRNGEVSIRDLDGEGFDIVTKKKTGLHTAEADWERAQGRTIRELREKSI